MFKMTVEDAKKLHDNLVTVAGPCMNKSEFFAGPLSDEDGNVYDAHVPFIRTLVFDDSCVILGIYGNIDAESLLGRTLVSS